MSDTPEQITAKALSDHASWLDGATRICHCGQRPLSHAAHQAAMILAAQREAGYEITRWLPTVGFAGYEVSDRGEVRSMKRTAARYLNGGLTHGYRTVKLRRDGIYVNMPIHRLVTAAFLGPCPEGLEVRHLDGNALNNDLSNLAYGTSSENKLDTVRHGNHPSARKTHCKRGHPLMGENLCTWPRKGGGVYRACRECRNMRERGYHKASLLAAAEAAEGAQR